MFGFFSLFTALTSVDFTRHPVRGSLTHRGPAEETHVKHDGVFRREREPSFGGVLPAVQHVAVRVGDLEERVGCKCGVMNVKFYFCTFSKMG